MSYIPKTIDEIVSEYMNRMTFLPAIQREFVWGPYEITKLFDSIMGDYPISTFLFWKIKTNGMHMNLLEILIQKSLTIKKQM
jgi:uncharacterized protein with ParB-like and HNH nuclease domain